MTSVCRLDAFTTANPESPARAARRGRVPCKHRGLGPPFLERSNPQQFVAVLADDGSDADRDAGLDQVAIAAKVDHLRAGDALHRGGLGPALHAAVPSLPLAVLVLRAKHFHRRRLGVGLLQARGLQDARIGRTQRRPPAQHQGREPAGARGQLQPDGGAPGIAPIGKAVEAGRAGHRQQIGAHAVGSERFRRDVMAATDAGVVHTQHAVAVGQPVQVAVEHRLHLAAKQFGERGHQRQADEQGLALALHLVVHAAGRVKRHGGAPRVTAGAATSR